MEKQKKEAEAPPALSVGQDLRETFLRPLPISQELNAYDKAGWTACGLTVAGCALLAAGMLLDWRLSH